MTQRVYNTSRWRRVLIEVLEREGYVCRVGIEGVCTGHAEVVDHVIPIVAGGDPFDVDDLRAGCPPRNSTLDGIVGQGWLEALTEGEPCPLCGHVVGGKARPRAQARVVWSQ